MSTNPDDFQVKNPKGKTVFVELGLGTNTYGIAAKTPVRTITVAGNHRGKRKLDTIVHEAAHHALPLSGESEIAKVAQFITEVLWKAGYRRKSEAVKRRSTKGSAL